MNGVDPVRLQAFLLALSQLDVALSQELHQAIQRIGVALALENLPKKFRSQILHAKLSPH